MRFVGPCFADSLIACEAAQGLEATAEVVGGDEVSQVHAQLVVRGVVEALDRRLLDGAAHPLDLPIIGHDARGAFLVQLFSFENRPMVSPSGTRGTGSTKVRAGRR